MHSTLTAMLETTNNWSINIDNGLLMACYWFIDLKKAFETIDHEIILRKLANYTLFLYKNVVFPVQAEYSIFLPILGWRYSCIILKL